MQNKNKENVSLMLAMQVFLKGNNSCKHSRSQLAIRRRVLLLFSKSLQANQEEPGKLKTEDVKMSHFKKFGEYLCSLNYSGRTKRMYELLLFQFFKLLVRHFKTSFQEIVMEQIAEVEKKYPTLEIEAIIASISPENAIGERFGKSENYFRPWIQPALRLMASTGLRLTELVNLRWSMLTERNENLFLEIPNRKSESPVRYVSLNKDAEEILSALSFDDKTSNQYIIAPEKAHRPYVQNFLHHAFRHFATLVVPQGNITIHDVRRSFIAPNNNNV